MTEVQEKNQGDISIHPNEIIQELSHEIAMKSQEAVLHKLVAKKKDEIIAQKDAEIKELNVEKGDLEREIDHLNEVINELKKENLKK